VVNGVEQFFTECKPDSTNIAIQSTIDGCDNPSLWNHDLAAGTSYGRERFYYLLDGIPQYVTECQDSEVAYPHHVETTGWQNHDDQLFAYRLTTVYIEGIHPGTLTVVTPHRDFKILAKVSREMERKYGLTIDPGMTDGKERNPNKLSPAARNYEAHTWQESFQRHGAATKPSRKSVPMQCLEANSIAGSTNKNE